MTVRANRGKISQQDRKLVASKPGELDRDLHLAELRRMVVTGRYEVKPQKLALKILARALRRGD